MTTQFQLINIIIIIIIIIIIMKAPQLYYTYIACLVCGYYELVH